VRLVSGGCWLSKERLSMLDVVFVGATVVFFAVAILYVRGCERLKPGGER